MTGGAVGLGALDRADDRPPYRQIADHLRAAIERGELRPGDRLPSEAALMKHYQVARMTARQAIQELRSEGKVVSEQGRGVFVRQAPPVRWIASERLDRRHRAAGLAAFRATPRSPASLPALTRSRCPGHCLRPRSATGSACQRMLPRSSGPAGIWPTAGPLRLRSPSIPADIADSTRIAEPDTGPGGIYAGWRKGATCSTGSPRKYRPGRQRQRSDAALIFPQAHQ
jgi:GntR family transcriptional regulator